MKKRGGKILTAILAAASILASVLSFPAMAGEWIPEENGQWSYRGDDGSAAFGWQQIDGSWYYFLENGIMATRWIQSDGKWYYMNLDGKMVSDTMIRNHVIGSDGAWIEVPQSERIEKTELYDVVPSYTWDSVWTNRKVTGMDKKEYGNSIVISGKSLIEYDLDGGHTRFSCRIVPRSGFSSGGSVSVVIYGDYDEELRRIEGIIDSFDEERIDVDITGQHVLGIRCIPDSSSDYDSIIINWPVIYR